ncbi:type II toxin-antitoxin system PemK/MazF family toxin [Actinomycetaceae bacterium L2_0104]
MGIMNSLARVAGTAVRDLLRPTRNGDGKRRSRRGSPVPGHGRSAGKPETSQHGQASGVPAEPTLTARSRSKFPGPGDIPMVYDVEALGLPRFEYSPRQDDQPDPGEVVWTWVPYEEDRSQGKDRPVLVLAEDSGRIVFAQLTSKDHVQSGTRRDRNGNHWKDIGSGSWDSRGRASEVRLDRLLCVHPDRVRREGSRLDATRFTEVVAAIKGLHR